ncbi:MAG TPA: HepT-like ribonuclease domain-containing protein [Spirochaetia bacterium]|nr:HepT-like ribonuclease domain-containing protein [Spirochaetia bacterium]
MPTAMALDELAISFDEQALVRLCETYGIAELSFFGSVTRDDFNPVRSDVDVLIEFLPDTPVRTLFMDQFSWFALRRDFVALFRRKVDIVEKEGLDKYIKDDVLRRRVVVYQSSGNGGGLVIPKRRGTTKDSSGQTPEWAKGVHAFVEIDGTAAGKIKKPDLYLFHMRDNCKLLLKSAASLTYEDFLERDEMWRRGVSKCIEEIGENAGKLSHSFRKNHPEIHWDKYIESRQHLAHVYEHVKMYTVWTTVTEEIPGLLAGLEALIQDVVNTTPEGTRE